MPDIDLDAIEARIAAATPGPWWRDPINTRDIYSEREPSDTSHDIATYVDTDADADLIAHAPTDLAALVGENERLRAVAEAARRAWPYVNVVAAGGPEARTDLINALDALDAGGEA